MKNLEFKGTKGEWELGGNTVDGILVSARHPQNRDICTVWKYDNNFLENQEAESNVKIIASAPELLKALQELHNLLEENLPQWYLRSHHNIAIKAIEKALN